MSRVCVLCEKKGHSGNKVSHSNRRTKRTFSPNVQKIDVDGSREYVCTRCLRTLKKQD